MERVGASSALWFDAAVLRPRMADQLGPALHLFMALVDGQPVAGGLFTAQDGIVEAHLGGSREGFSAYSPVRIVAIRPHGATLGCGDGCPGVPPRRRPGRPARLAVPVQGDVL